MASMPAKTTTTTTTTKEANRAVNKECSESVIGLLRPVTHAGSPLDERPKKSIEFERTKDRAS